MTCRVLTIQCARLILSDLVMSYSSYTTLDSYRTQMWCGTLYWQAHQHYILVLTHVTLRQILTPSALRNAFFSCPLMLISTGSWQVMRAMPAVMNRTRWWAAILIRDSSGSSAKSCHHHQNKLPDMISKH